MDGGTRARVEEEKALDSSRLRSSARLGFASSSSAGNSRIARRKRKKRRRQQRQNSNVDVEVDDEDELGGSGGVASASETTDTILPIPIKEEQHRQPAGSTSPSEEHPSKQPKNRSLPPTTNTNESQRNVTRGGSGSRAAASSLSAGITLLNRRAASKRSSRRCNASARRNAMTMDLQRLITEVHARPAIWDQKNVNYHNRDVILKMWREIARACEVSSEYTPRSPPSLALLSLSLSSFHLFHSRLRRSPPCPLSFSFYHTLFTTLTPSSG